MEAFNVSRGVFGTRDNGGGIFSTGVGGLGSSSSDLPYMQYSEKTYNTQLEINAIAGAVGIGRVKEDGVLGPETCSAIKAIIAKGGYSGWTLPAACSGSSSSSASTVTTSPTTTELPPAMTTGGSSVKKGLLIAAVAAVGLFGGYWAYKRYVK